MKTLVALFIVFTFCSSSALQAQVKIYAFLQPVISGVKNKAIEEGGKEIDIPGKKRFNLLFFLENRPGKEVKPLAVFYKGEGYDVKVSAVENTPLIMDQPQVPGNRDTVTLVRATENKVIKMLPDYDKKTPLQKTGKLKRLLASNDVVVAYLCKGKVHYKTVKQITELAPVAMQ